MYFLKLLTLNFDPNCYLSFFNELIGSNGFGFSIVVIAFVPIGNPKLLFSKIEIKFFIHSYFERKMVSKFAL